MVLCNTCKQYPPYRVLVWSRSCICCSQWSIALDALWLWLTWGNSTRQPDNRRHRLCSSIIGLNRMLPGNCRPDSGTPLMFADEDDSQLIWLYSIYWMDGRGSIVCSACRYSQKRGSAIVCWWWLTFNGVAYVLHWNWIITGSGAQRRWHVQHYTGRQNGMEWQWKE